MAGRVVLGAVIAAGSLMLVPGVAPAVARAARPLVRAGLRSGASAFEEFRKAAAEAYETFEDLAAEVQADLSAARDHAAEAPAASDGEAAAPEPPDGAGSRE